MLLFTPVVPIHKSSSRITFTLFSSCCSRAFPHPTCVAMSLSPVFLDVNSWVPAPILDAKPTRLLSEEEMNTLTRDFSRCFEGQTPSFTDVDGVFPYWMDNGWYNLSLPLSGLHRSKSSKARNSLYVQMPHLSPKTMYPTFLGSTSRPCVFRMGDNSTTPPVDSWGRTSAPSLVSCLPSRRIGSPPALAHRTATYIQS